MGCLDGLKNTFTTVPCCTTVLDGGSVWYTWFSGTSAFSSATGSIDRPASLRVLLATS